MRVIKRLEKRFNKALDQINTSAPHAEGDAEVSKLSDEIKALAAWKSEQETVLEKATSDIEAAQKEVSDMTASNTALEAEKADLAANVEALTKSGEVAQNQLSELAAQKLAAEVALQQAQDSIAETPKTDAAVEELTVKLEAAEQANADLKAELKVAKAQPVPTGDASEIAKELAELKAQREIDLTEVNVILEKLIPLVEAK